MTKTLDVRPFRSKQWEAWRLEKTNYLWEKCCVFSWRGELFLFIYFFSGWGRRGPLFVAAICTQQWHLNCPRPFETFERIRLVWPGFLVREGTLGKDDAIEWIQIFSMFQAMGSIRRTCGILRKVWQFLTTLIGLSCSTYRCNWKKRVARRQTTNPMTSWLLKIFRGIPFSNWVFADLPCMRIIGFCTCWILVCLQVSMADWIQWAFFRSEICEWVFLKRMVPIFKNFFMDMGQHIRFYFKSVWRMLKTNIFTHSMSEKLVIHCSIPSESPLRHVQVGLLPFFEGEKIPGLKAASQQLGVKQLWRRFFFDNGYQISCMLYICI